MPKHKIPLLRKIIRFANDLAPVGMTGCGVFSVEKLAQAELERSVVTLAVTIEDPHRPHP